MYYRLRRVHTYKRLAIERASRENSDISDKINEDLAVQMRGELQRDLRYRMRAVIQLSRHFQANMWTQTLTVKSRNKYWKNYIGIGTVCQQSKPLRNQRKL